MRTLWNDLFRWLIGCLLVILGGFLHIYFLYRVFFYKCTQKRLKKIYNINAKTPIQSFNSNIQDSILALHQSQQALLIETSGSTALPKKILYTKTRLLWTMFQFVDVFARAFFFLRPKRKSLFILSSMGKDNSLTSSLLNDSPAPSWISSLQAPYRLLAKIEFTELVAKYDLDAVRIFILTITNPGVLYCTNPSTLFIFLEGLEKNWQNNTRLIRDFYNHQDTFSPALHRTLRKITSHGYQQRLNMIASSREYIPFHVMVPGVEIYSCWTGGYVKPFLIGLEKYLLPHRHRLLPMYSMSTETIETVTDCSNKETVFLPMGKNTVYEFIELGKEDLPENLQTELEVDKTYTMVVSDAYGLKRYQTNDLFECKSIYRGLPNLHFLRRRNLEYSFTGEKITAEQLTTVYSNLRSKYEILSNDHFLTCIPSKPKDELPHFNLIIVGTTGLSSDQRSTIAKQADLELSLMNHEYQSKIQSRRLNPIQCYELTMGEFMERMVHKDHNKWQAQFKILPLYQKLWESCELE